MTSAFLKAKLSQLGAQLVLGCLEQAHAGTLARLLFQLSYKGWGFVWERFCGWCRWWQGSCAQHISSSGWWWRGWRTQWEVPRAVLVRSSAAQTRTPVLSTECSVFLPKQPYCLKLLPKPFSSLFPSLASSKNSFWSHLTYLHVSCTIWITERLAIVSTVCRIQFSLFCLWI